MYYRFLLIITNSFSFLSYAQQFLDFIIFLPQRTRYSAFIRRVLLKIVRLIAMNSENPEKMNKMGKLQLPLKPTWRRYFKIFIQDSKISIYRALEYEALSKLSFSGRILDLGGGEKAHYTPSMKSWIKDGSYESVNISEAMEPTFLIRSCQKLPIADNDFDMVVSINTLEHICNLEATLKEIVRVLKSGGKLVLAVPFLFRVHGCPDDYNRPTASWWDIILTRLNISDIKITPLVWDVMTTGLSVTEGVGPFKKLRRILVPLYGLLYAQIKGGVNEYYPHHPGRDLSNFALGYIITGIKTS